MKNISLMIQLKVKKNIIALNNIFNDIDNEYADGETLRM